MRRIFQLGIGALAAAMVSSAAIACGQMAPVEVARAGHVITVRGYGYGFEGGARSVTLVWADTRASAALAEINANGEFAVEVRAPLVPGEYKLMAHEGTNDPAPAIVTVRVLGPAT